jgi:hypothetical protein
MPVPLVAHFRRRAVIVADVPEAEVSVRVAAVSVHAKGVGGGEAREPPRTK